MDRTDREIFLHVVSEYGFTENDFEISEETEVARPNEEIPFSGKRTLTHKRSGASKTYDISRQTAPWLIQLEDDFAAGFFKKK